MGERLLRLDGANPKEKDNIYRDVMAQVKASFAPELLNRLSATVVFNPLGSSELERIVQKAMNGVQKRLLSKGIKVVLEKSGAQAVLDASYDPNYGARPVERYLEGSVVTKLGRMLIAGELKNGTVVHVEGSTFEDDSLDDCDMPPAKRARTLQFRVEERM